MVPGLRGPWSSMLCSTNAPGTASCTATAREVALGRWEFDQW